MVPCPIGLREAMRICIHIRIKFENQFKAFNFIGQGRGVTPARGVAGKVC